jgi:hypothetical protein
VDNASIVTIDFVRNAIDLDAVTRALKGRDDMEASTENGKPMFEGAQGFEFRLDAGSIDFYPVSFRTEARDFG